MRELSKATFCRYGSYTPGIADWEARWDSSPGRRVLLYAFRDYAGSFMKWADAINRHTDFAARLVVFDRRQYGYENDLLLPAFNHALQRIAARSVREARQTDYIYTLWRLRAKVLCGPKVSGIRPKELSRSRSDDARSQLRLVRRRFRIPHAIDSDLYPYRWTNGRRLAHSPSTAKRKGTADLLAAIECLDLEFDLISGVSHEVISGVSHEECVRRKSEANLFFDQAGCEIEQRLGTSAIVGWYGNSALEAAVYGIPTIAHLSEQAYQLESGLLRATAAGFELDGPLLDLAIPAAHRRGADDRPGAVAA